MGDRETTVRSRELGEGLRAAMQKAGLTGTDAARALGWSESRISRLLSGKRGGAQLDVASFLAVCRVTGEARDRLLRLCGDLDTPGWLQQFGSRLPTQLSTLIDHEDKAVCIRDFQLTMVPGLLQTADYARALISATANVPRSEVQSRVAARLRRRNVLVRPRPARFTFFVHEFVLRLPVGGPAVMSDQLHHLLRMSVRPAISLRVVPSSIGAHAGVAGHFKLMEFTAFPPVVYLDSETSSLFLEEPEEVAAYRQVLRALAETALDEGQSRELIAAVAVELYGDRDNHDDSARAGRPGLAQEQLQLRQW